MLVFLCLLASILAPGARAAPSDVDNGFGSGGEAFTAGVGSQSFREGGGSELLVQADGKTLAISGGNDPALSPFPAGFGVARFDVNGQLDRTFAGDGVAVIRDPFPTNANATPAQLVVEDAALQSDGKSLIVGRPEVAAQRDGGVARLNTDGTLDTSFAGDGFLTIDPGAFGLSIVVLEDGSLVVTGTKPLSRDNPFLHISSGGMILSQTTSAFSAVGSALSDGKILTVNQPEADSFVRLVRRNADGTLDPSYNGDGVAEVGTPGAPVELRVQGDGGALLLSARRGATPKDDRFALLRTDSNGALDPAFGTNGVVVRDFGSGFFPYGLALQPDGKIVLTGGGGNGLIVARLLADGTPDPSFNPNGTGFVSLGPSKLAIPRVAFDGRGRAIIGGRAVGRGPTVNGDSARFPGVGALRLGGTPMTTVPATTTVVPLIRGPRSLGLVRVDRKGRFVLPRQLISCEGAGPGCRATATAFRFVPRRASRRRTVRIANSLFKVATGKKARVRLRLSAKGRRFLFKHRRVRAVVTLGVRRGSKAAKKSVRATLQAPKTRNRR